MRLSLDKVDFSLDHPLQTLEREEQTLKRALSGGDRLLQTLERKE